MNKLKKYALSYKEFLSINFAEDMTYRSHFVLLILMDLITLGVILMSVSVIYNHVERIGDWDKNQFLFFISFILTVGQIHMVFLSENFWMFSDKIKTGSLDFVLLRPIGSLFVIYFRHIRTGSLPGLAAIIGVLIYCGLQIDLSPWHWVIMPFLILLSLTLKMSLEVLLSLSSMWMVESFGINFLRMQFQSLARWPDFVYKYHTRLVFSFAIPILLTASAPVRYIFNSQDYMLLLYSFFAIAVTWVLIAQVWKMGVRQYESASS